MRLIGIQLNLISLGAMALAVGMVVDGSIVVLENVYRWLNPDFKMPDGQAAPKDRIELIILATKEVFLPILVSLLTTIVVFIPLTFHK